MSAPRPVTVHPPDDDGGRLVRIHGTDAGRAYDLWDVIVFLQRAGLGQDLADEDDVAASDLIAWLDAGPHVWEP